MLTETNALVGCLKCEAFNMIQVNKVHTFFFLFLDTFAAVSNSVSKYKYK